MSYASAYSLELKTDLSAKEAYDFSLLPINHPNHLSNHKNFQCSEGCTFKLTLANFNNPDFTKTPYFTSGARNQEHDTDNCQLMIEHYQQREQDLISENHGCFSREKNKIIIDLDLVKGALAIVTKPRQKNENTPTSNLSNPELRHQRSHSASTVDNKTFRSHVKQLSSLVRYFLEYQSGEKYTFYSKNNQEIQLEKYFVNLSEVSQTGVNIEDIHIYYDTATVKSFDYEHQPEKNYFLIRFNSKCTVDGLTNYPTIIINKSLAKHHGVMGKLSTLEKAAKDKQPLKLFYFGKFRKHNSNKYINPDVSYEDILDYLVIS